tara:strand:- start:2 stop:244 length:243 start_codon:yes stop_codon:yes gene_type:complete
MNKESQPAMIDINPLLEERKFTNYKPVCVYDPRKNQKPASSGSKGNTQPIDSIINTDTTKKWGSNFGALLGDSEGGNKVA